MENNENRENNCMPLIGDRAPEFRAMTTMGKVNFPEDYKGSWVVLFSHPADFTPVCTTEFIEFSKMAEDFYEMNTKLIGLSIDSVHSHLAWSKSIAEIEWKGEKIGRVPFPIIADISMNVAKKYGMLQTVARTQTIRAVFIIDPEGIIRTILYYPMSCGRNIPEIKRIIQALQIHDEEDVVTPANWFPGDEVLLGAPLTLEEAGRREEDDEIDSLEWYLSVKNKNENQHLN